MPKKKKKLVSMVSFENSIKKGDQDQLDKIVYEGWTESNFHNCLELAYAIYSIVSKPAPTESRVRIARKYSKKLAYAFINLAPKDVVKVSEMYRTEYPNAIDFVGCFTDVGVSEGGKVDADYAVKFFGLLSQARAFLLSESAVDDPIDVLQDKLAGLYWLGGVHINAQSFVWQGLIQAVSEGNGIALDIFRDIYSYHCLSGEINIKPIKANDYKRIQPPFDGSSRDLIMSLWGWNIGRSINLPIPDEFYSRIELMVEGFKIEEIQVAQDWELLINWFRSNLKIYEEEAREMWDDITNRSVAPLLPRGLDKVELKLFPKHLVDRAKCIQFFPEKYEYPNIMFKVWRVTGGIETVSQLPLRSDIDRFDDPDFSENMLDWIDMIMKFAALSCYHSIVTKHEVRPVSKDFVKTLRTKAKKRPELVGHIFRSRLRNLPEGHHSSKTAQELCLNSWYARLPPPHQTFVSHFTKGKTEEEIEKSYKSVDDIPVVRIYSLREIGFKKE